MRAMIISLGLAVSLVACAEDPNIFADPDVVPVDAGQTASTSSSTETETGTGGNTPLPALGYENGTRLRARVLHGDDGSRQFVGWHDSERAEDCSFRVASDGATRCMPLAPYYAGSYYQDSQCTVMLALAATAGCAEPTYASQTTTGCPTGIRIYAVGSVLTPANVYVGSGVSCTQTATPAGYTFRTVGAEIAPTSFALATLATD